MTTAAPAPTFPVSAPPRPSAAATADEAWRSDTTYVVGHQRPDTDAIGSALGYAWFLRASGSELEPVVAARAGQPGPQALFVLRRFGLSAPRLLNAVWPTFGHVARKIPPAAPDTPVLEAMARLAGGQERVVAVADVDGTFLGAITPLALARAFSQAGGGGDPIAPWRECQHLLEPLPTFRERDRVSDHRAALVRSPGDDFVVLDGAGKYVGLATRQGVLSPPRARLVLVDHNELDQAVAGAGEAEIVAVLDHHRLGNPPTVAPIPFVVEPVGSTCTLVGEQCRSLSLPPPPGLAGVLLSGILSDTLVFRSPTTTERDRAVGKWLAALADVENVAGYGDELLRASPGLGARDAREILDADRKLYQMSEAAVSAAQIEVTGLQELPERRDDLLAAMADLRQRENLALLCLMVTDVVAGRSRLLCQGEERLLAALPFARLSDHEWELGDIVSRKKQLVPALLSVLDEAGF